MLSEIELRLFKCFEHLRLPLSPLTLLSGPNASGKSSVIQALVLLHQTVHTHEWSTRLILNGTGVQLGTMADVVDAVHGRRRNFAIGLLDDDTAYLWEFNGEPEEMSAGIESVSVAGEVSVRPRMLRHLLPASEDSIGLPIAQRLRDLAYITAERVGPRELYPIEDQRVAAAVGPRGEHAISLLYSGRDEYPSSGLVLKEVPPIRLRQVEQRMRMFFPGFGLELARVPHANAITLGLRTSTEMEHHRPIHTGFGITQTLPIVIAALSANRGDILLIENPEVHLHPAGQALMGQFLADVASAGIQVILETHSDHVLNGVRRSVKGGQLDAEQVAIHFFKPRIEGDAQVISPMLDPTGNVDAWPEGFFDQFDRDMNYFAGWATKMELLFNDLSLHGQFSSITAFREAIGHVIRMRALAQRFGRDLYCHRNVANARVISGVYMMQAAQALDMSARQALTRWITQHGPFWEDSQLHSPDDYLECNDEVVTETGVGEAAYGCFQKLDRRLVSLFPSDWQYSPVDVTWHGGAQTITISVENYWQYEKLENALQVAPQPMNSWQDLERVSVAMFPDLTFAPSTFEPILPYPFGKAVANRILERLNVLNQLKNCFDMQGNRTTDGHALYQKHFTGARAWFSDSSETEKTEFRQELTFRHPLSTGEYLFCTWHGKVSTGVYRIHFSWPVTADTPLCVVYVGPKITKR